MKWQAVLVPASLSQLQRQFRHHLPPGAFPLSAMQRMHPFKMPDRHSPLSFLLPFLPLSCLFSLSASLRSLPPFALAHAPSPSPNKHLALTLLHVACSLGAYLDRYPLTAFYSFRLFLWVKPWDVLETLDRAWFLADFQ